jgi:hypothetical protein
MKKYIKFAALALAVVLASCSSEEDGTDFVEVGGNAVPQASISRLDRNFDLPIAIFTKEGVTATKVEIYQNIAATTADPIKLGPKVADATIANGKATFNTSTLGSFDVFPVTQTDGTVTLNGKTGVLVLAILTSYSDGSSTRAPYRLTVSKGIVWKADDHGSATNTTTSTSGVTAVLYNDPTPVNIHYATVSNTGTVVDKVEGEWSINGGAYSPIPGLTFSTSKQTIDVAGLDYIGAGVQPDDVVTFKFTVTAGTQTDAITTKITYAEQVFDGAKDGALSNSDTTSQFSFQTGLNYDGADTAHTEVTFTSPFGFVRSSNDVRIEFVKANGLNFNTTTLLQAEAAFNAGTKVSGLNNLVLNDVVLYKVTRNVNLGSDDEPDFQDVTYYGLIQITDRVAGTTSQKLSFSYKEGVLHLAEPTTPVVID